MKEVNAAEKTLPKPPSIDLPSTGEVDTIERPVLQASADPAFDEYAKQLAFMEEMVEVYIHPTQDKTAEAVFPVGVNGVLQYFVRGRKQTVKRKYIAVLADARPEAIETNEFTDYDGARNVRIDRTASLKYPFSVTRDTAEGAAWLDKILSNT